MDHDVHQPKRIAVIGAGAIGGLVGGLLAEGGHEVWLIDKWHAHVEAIRQGGLQLTSDGYSRSIGVHATSDPTEVGHVDLVLVQVKSYATGDAAQTALALCGEETVCLTLQNGLGNREALEASLGDVVVLAGVTYQAASVSGPGSILHSRSGPTALGGRDAIAARAADWVADLFKAAGMPAEATASSDDLLWAKLIVNAAFNASCGLTSASVGDIGRYPSSRALTRAVVDEVSATASAAGVQLDNSREFDRIMQISEAGGQAKPSLLQDLEQGAWTEIDAINGAVMRTAESHGVSVPYNRTLTLLVRLAEEASHGCEPPWRA